MPLKGFGFFILLGVSALSVSCAHASEHLWDGKSGAEMSLSEAVRDVRAGDVVVIGEVHGNAGSQNGQMGVLKALRERNLKVSVGMEFLTYQDQEVTDQFRAGLLPEAEFLKMVKWGEGFPFKFYREQVLFPLAEDGEATRALNAPRALTGKVAKSGLESLTDAEKAQLPPNLTRGNDRYFERFKESIGHLPNPEAADRYFWAQSIWDETMAWKSLEYLNLHPEQVFVIIVGEFHVQYGGGLPDRLRQRGAGKVWTFSQLDVTGLSAEEREREKSPSLIDGPRADFVWTFGSD